MLMGYMTMPNPPTPTRLRQLRGNPGHRPIPKGEPRPSGKLGRPPGYLSRDAKQVWRYMAPKLDAAGIGTTVDRPTFESFCRSYALWRTLRRQGEAEPLVKTNGQTVSSPALALAAKEHREWSSIAREFGMTPSARVKLATGAEDEQDELAEFMAPRPTPQPVPMRLVGGE